MKLIGVALFGVFAGAIWAQPALTAEQVMEKNLEASGGRQALERITSTVGKGALEVPSQGVTATFEFYAKAPDKRLIVVKVEGRGDLRRGCDGPTVWEDHPIRGYRVTEGEEREETLRDCVFNGELKWRELYPKVELAGKEQIGGRETYKLILTPTKGKPITRYLDAETFLGVRQVSTRTTSQGPVEVQTEISDYREVDGIKGPSVIKEITAGQEVIIRILEVKNNVPLEDARFAKPAPN